MDCAEKVGYQKFFRQRLQTEPAEGEEIDDLSRWIAACVKDWADLEVETKFEKGFGEEHWDKYVAGTLTQEEIKAVQESAK